MKNPIERNLKRYCLYKITKKRKMVDRDLISFIRESLNSGHSLEAIKPVLRAKGWQENEIEKACDKASQNQTLLNVSISFVLFIILTATFVFSIFFSQTKLTAAVVGTETINQNVAGLGLAFTLYILLASTIWLRMLYAFLNRKNRL